MREFARRAALVTGVLGAAIGLTTTTASATATLSWHVAPSGPFTAHAVYPTLTVPAATFPCVSSDVTAGTLAATSATGNGIGNINNIKFTTCKIGATDFAMTMKVTPWKIDVAAINVTNPQWVDGKISSVSAHIKGSACDVDLTGTIPVHYENDTGNLVLPGTGTTLIASSASCYNLIKNGDVVKLKATYAVSTHPSVTTP
ncbi:hypothetical protein [Streptomyces beijiangensis]|uniref:Secreted protein n=1 Tax=Streptomyces beijiangensis TaxID=163361 RepID=A0A939F6S0_9ACTN|nr:hypothetical protein [Streptomyces beijiangensis]MBO0512739.1 hypothetical protein [Streptomyces beijiangensis]